MKNNAQNNKSEDDCKDSNASSTSKRGAWLRSMIVFVVILGGTYFAHLELQSYLGKQALAKTAFPDIQFEAALTQASKHNKYVFANLTAIWCPSCRRLDQTVFSNESVQESIKKQFVYTRVDYDTPQGKQFMERYGYNSFPTLLVINANGKLIKRLPLTFNPETFIRQLEPFRDKTIQNRVTQSKVARDPIKQ